MEMRSFPTEAIVAGVVVSVVILIVSVTFVVALVLIKKMENIIQLERSEYEVISMLRNSNTVLATISPI